MLWDTFFLLFLKSKKTPTKESKICKSTLVFWTFFGLFVTFLMFKLNLMDFPIIYTLEKKNFDHLGTDFWFVHPFWLIFERKKKQHFGSNRKFFHWKSNVLHVFSQCFTCVFPMFSRCFLMVFDCIPTYFLTVLNHFQLL